MECYICLLVFSGALNLKFSEAGKSIGLRTCT